MKGKVLSYWVLLFAGALAVITGLLSHNADSYAQGNNPQINIVYGEVNGQSLLLDIYQPPASDVPHPAVILIHGGAGSFGERDVMVDHAEGLSAAGYTVFNIHYRLLDGGTNPWPAQLDDAQLAVRWVRANADQYNVDSDRICALGHSFGGQLAALLGERDTPTDSDLPLAEYSSRVACVISIAAGLDATRLYLDSVIDVEMDLYGGTPSETPETYRDASPLAQVTADTAPFLLFHGADDENTSVEESRVFVEALYRAGVPVVYVEVPHATHFYWINFFEPGGWDYVDLETLAFLERQLQPAN